MKEEKTNSAPQASSAAKPEKASFTWAKKLISEAKKPKGFSVTAAKRAMQLVTGQGKEPAAFKVAPDGSFAIELVQVGKPAAAPTENPWDAVL